MHIDRIELDGFTVHQQARVFDLPQAGVVVVTGTNGSGKSSVVEAVSMAGWGKTLRGTDPWRDGEDGRVAIVSDLVTVARTRSCKGRGGMGFQTPGNASATFDTPTEAQRALETVIGSHDVWRKTSVFSSSDASHFTMATDAERKRLLESLLGLDRFDDALSACRRDLSAAVSAESAAASDVRVLTAKIDGARRRIEDAQAALATVEDAEGAPEDPSALSERLGRLTAGLEACVAELRAAQQAVTVAEREITKAESEAKAARTRADRLAAMGECPTCGQHVPDPLKAAAADLAADALDRAKEIAEASDLALKRGKAQVDELAEEAEELRRSRAQTEAARTAADSRARRQMAVDRQRQGFARTLTEAQAELESADAELAGRKAEAATSGEEVAVLRATEQVLGMRGVRAQVVARALNGLETAANGWLGRVAGPGVRLRLQSSVPLKKGEVVDKIGLEIDGVGGGRGYKATSGGERRRIDIALLLALSEVAQAAAGSSAGTLFCDEVFDALDADGVQAVSLALADLAQDRAVVVITHSAALARSLPAALRIDMDGQSDDDTLNAA